MSSAETVHKDGQIFRHITVGAVTYSWEIVDDDESSEGPTTSTSTDS